MPSGPCQAPTRRTACHARCGRLDAAWCHVAGCGHRLETVDAMTVGAEDEVRLPFIPLGKQVGELLEHLMALPRPTWLVTCKSSAPSGMRVPWATGCPTDDIWQCMYGRAEGMASPRYCECDRPMAFSRRDLYLTMLNAILLQGNRTSPLVPNGPAPPALIYPDGGVAVSVHVRGGDSCDIVVHAANRTTWGYWAPTSDVRIRRFCVHPSVHLAAVRALMASRNVHSVLLATDQTEAVDIFRPLEREGIELHLHNFDRRPLAHAGAGADPPDNWIEYRMLKRPEIAGHVMASAIEDVRHLARGHVLVAAMCSRFSQLVHGAMIAHNRREVEVVTLDKCQPLCDEERGLEYDEQMRWNFGLSPDGSQSQAADRGQQPPLLAGSSPPFFGTELASLGTELASETAIELIEGTW